MFNGLELTVLNLSNFNTSNVINMSYIFRDNKNLKSLDLSNFNTSLVLDMNRMFCKCPSLEVLNIINFDTSQVTNMECMFYNCKLLKELNLSSFDTSNVVTMCNMFYNCSKLILLDLSNFNISKVTNFYEMFFGCNNLEYINLGVSKSINSPITVRMFNDTVRNLVICTINDEIKRADKPECSIIYCGKNWREKQKRIYNDICYDNCSIIEKYEYNYSCHESCPNGTYNNNFKCDKCEPNCLLCNQPNFCILCNESYHNLYINDSYSYCNESTEGFYLDIKDFFYKQCYLSCKTCNKGGNKILHNCIDCKDEYPFIQMASDYKNCYDNNNNEKINNQIEIKMQKLLMNLTNNAYNSTLIDNKIQLITKNKTIYITFTSTYEQNMNEDKNNETTINLGLCENKLKDPYNISYNNSLYILKIDINETGMKIPKIEYEVYYPLYDLNLEKLDLSKCENIRVELSIPVYLDNDIDKHNLSSGYYNNICSKTTSKYGTDICLKDRQKEFIDNNMTLCEENCDLIDYNEKTKKAKCSCEIKIKLPLIEEVRIDTNLLYKRFTDIDYIANINFLKCYKIVFQKNELKNNYGFYFFMCIFCFYFIVLILFVCRYYEILKNNILNIISAKKNIKKKKCKKIRLKKENILDKKHTEIKRSKKESIKKRKLKIKSNKKSSNQLKLKSPLTTINLNSNLININSNIQSSKSKFDKKNKKEIIKEFKITESLENKKYKEILKLNDYELNSLSYKKALKKDKRFLYKYYFSLLKINHLFFFAFINNNDYNSKILKIFILIFSLTVNITVNALFFNDDTLTKIYNDKGKFNIIYQIPQIIYSSIISIVINTIIKTLALSEKDVVKIKQEKIINNIDEKLKQLLFKLKAKFVSFFILSFLLLVIFFVYITCFCGIYENTQIHLIKDSLIGFGISMLYPFLLYLLPSVMRIAALKAKKKDKNYLYKFSTLLEIV